MTFPHKRLLAMAALAVVSAGAWTPAAQQARNLKGKARGSAAITFRLRPASDTRVSAVSPGIRKLGLITGHSSPGVFILNPDTNTASGPILSGQIDPASISCAAITPDGLTGIIESKGTGKDTYGYDRTEMVLYFVDLSDPSGPILLGTATYFFSDDSATAGHLCLSPDGKYVIATARDYTHFSAEYFGVMATFQVSSRTMVSATGPPYGVVCETCPSLEGDLPITVIAPDGETVLVTNARYPVDGYIYRLDPSSGQLTLKKSFYPLELRGASLSPDGRTALIGTGTYIGQPALSIFLSILRLDSPCNLVSTGKLAASEFPSSIAFAPGGKKAYVIGSNALRVLNVISPGVVEDSGIAIPVDTTEAKDADSFAVEPQGRFAYVGGPAIRIIDLKTNSIVGTVAPGAKSISFANPILADVGLTKSVDNLYPILGDTVSFAVTAANNGPRDATGVSVSDRLPDGLSYVSHATISGSYDPAKGLWNIGSLGQEGLAVLTIRAKTEKIGSMTNTAGLQAINQIDPESANDTASTTVEADIRPDFSNPRLNYEAVDRLAAHAGQTITFTIHYGNTGGRAVGVVITSPADSRLENFQPLDGGVISSGKITWNLGRVPSNASGSVRFKADVGRGVPRGTKIVIQAAIFSDRTNPVVTNTVFVTVL